MTRQRGWGEGVTPPRLEGVITLDDGRRLGFAEFGDPNGRGVFWFHGTPGARRQIPEEARVAAEERGVCLVGIDRPGVGDSTTHLYRSIADFAPDLGVVADRLGLDRFAVIGLSGGGPYVLACAALLPDRVTAAAVLGGVAPTQGPDAATGGLVGFVAPLGPVMAALRVPLSAGISTLIWALRPVASPGLDLYARFSPEGDRRVFARPEVKAMFLDDLLHGSRTGLRAPILDAVLFTRDWGFSLEDVRVPVRWWHGDADHIVPLAHAEHVVARLPHAELTVRPGESHLGTLGVAEEILTAVLHLWDDGAVARRS
jgi:pimeloyl-ACP methyl ester carboxylesterase